MNLLWRCLQALGLNAVPAGGVLLGSWSWDTALKLFWFENLLGGLFIGLRIALHRRWTGKRGHFRAHAMGGGAVTADGDKKVGRQPGSLLASFLGPTLLFTAVHGFFLGMILYGVLGRESEPGAATLRAGALAIAALLAGGFLFDLVSLRERPFRWVRELAEYHLGRVVLVHVAIVGGFMFLIWRGHQPQAFFLAFAGLKTMADLSSLLTRAAGIERVEMTAEPPPWLARVMNKLGGKHRAEDFQDHWRRASELQREAETDDERVERPARRR